MDDLHLNRDLEAAHERLVSLSRRVEPDPLHYAHLRQELLRRHQELRTDDTTQRTVRSLWSRLTGLKRLTLVAPPALAAAVVLFAVISGVQISGHQSSPTADAAQITQALAHTAPTVTAWQVNVEHERGNSAASVQCPSALKKGQHFFVRDGHAYFFDGTSWYRVSASLAGGSSQCPLDLQWAFAILPEHLQRGQFTILPDAMIAGRRAEGVQYVTHRGKQTITATEWVDRSTGLVVRAQRIFRRSSVVVERDVADYSYSVA